MTETQGLIQQLGSLSYLGIFGISMLANVVIPVPEEVVLLALGYVVGAGELSNYIVIPLVILGLLLSDVVMYTLSHKGNRLVTLFYNKFFAKMFESRRPWIEQNPENVIFYSRFMVQLRFLGPFFAGQLGVPLKKFLKYEIFALIIYVPLLIWAGHAFQDSIELIASGVGIVKNIVLIIFGITIIVAISKVLRRWIFGKK